MLLSNSQLNLTTIWMLLPVAFHCLPWAPGSHHHIYSLRDLLSSLMSIIPASLMGSPLGLLESWYPLALVSLLSSVYTAQRCIQWGPGTSEHVVQMIGHEKPCWINILTSIQTWPEVNLHKDSDLCLLVHGLQYPQQCTKQGPSTCALNGWMRSWGSAPSYYNRESVACLSVWGWRIENAPWTGLFHIDVVYHVSPPFPAWGSSLSIQI